MSPRSLSHQTTFGSPQSSDTSHWGYSYRVQPDGTLQDKQRFYWFHVPDPADDSGASALAFDRDGRLYAATRMGVQVLDRNGRSRAILPLPDNGEATSLCFGGKDFDTLFVAAGGKVYSRKLRSRGAGMGSADQIAGMGCRLRFKAGGAAAIRL